MPPKKRVRSTTSGNPDKRQKVVNIIDQKFMKVKDKTFQQFLMNELRSKGQENLAMLYKLMGAPETYKGIKRAKRESGLTADQIIERQIASMDKHTIKYDKTGRIFELQSDDIIDFALMMYLDMYHDETVTTDFGGFLKSRIPTTFLKRKEIPFQETNFLKKLKDIGIIGDNLIPIKGFETEFKNNLSSIFDLTDIKPLPARKTGFMKRRIYMCIDQEGKQGHLSALVGRSDRGENKKQYMILPLLTPANFIDAGGGMVGAGVRAEAERMFDYNRDFRLRGKFVPNVDTFVFGRSIIQIIPGDKYKIKLNSHPEVKAGVTKANAKDPTATTLVKISKFLGDFLQILSVELIKELKIPVVTASGDGMMAAMSVFIQQRVLNRGKKTKFILDKSLMGSADIIEYYGLSGYLRSKQVKNGPVPKSEIKYNNGNITNNEFSPGSKVVPARGAKKRNTNQIIQNELNATKNRLAQKNKELSVKKREAAQNKQKIAIQSFEKKRIKKELAKRALQKAIKNKRIAQLKLAQEKKENEERKKRNENAKKRAAASASAAQRKKRNESAKKGVVVKRKRGNNAAATKPESIMRTASAPKPVKVNNAVAKKAKVNKSVVSATPKKATSKSPNTVLVNSTSGNSSASSKRN
mgnify:CR=1 FL=1